MENTPSLRLFSVRTLGKGKDRSKTQVYKPNLGHPSKPRRKTRRPRFTDQTWGSQRNRGGSLEDPGLRTNTGAPIKTEEEDSKTQVYKPNLGHPSKPRRKTRRPRFTDQTWGTHQNRGGRLEDPGLQT